MKRDDYVLILRTCNSDMTSHKGFKWPREGHVEAPDWDATPKCGNGLHGLLWGEGEGALLEWSADAVWIVAKVRADSVVALGGKVKFPQGEVVYAGDRKTATDMILSDPRSGGRAVVGVFITGGDHAIVTGGYRATVTGGDWSVVTGGNGATVTGGYRATVTGGYWSTVTGGDVSTLTGGKDATVTGADFATLTGADFATLTGGKGAIVTGGNGANVTGGYRANVTGGEGSTVTGGDWSTVTGGDLATVTGGEGAIVTGGQRATVTGGIGSQLLLRWHDEQNHRYRTAIAYVGDDGIKPDTPYRLNGDYKFEEFKS